MTIIEFPFHRDGLAPLSLSVDTGTARLLTTPDRAVSPITTSALLDFPHYMHPPRFLEPRESVEEVHIVGDRRIGRWLLTAEFGIGVAAAGVGLLGIIAGWWA